MKHTVETINDQKSHKSGAVGLLETTLRKFKNLAFIGALFPIAFLYALCLSVALFPGISILVEAYQWTLDSQLFIRLFTLSLAAGFGFLAFILVLIFVVPIANWPIKFFVKPYRGAWYSLESIPWFYHNALTYLVRYTVLNLITPSPIAIYFFKAMGMKIGKNAVINTGNISDPCLIEIGDYVTIGGSVYLMAHYGMKGYLIVDKLKINKGANIGLHSYIMAATVLEFATILPNSVVLPKTTIPANAKFGHIDTVMEIKESSHIETK